MPDRFDLSSAPGASLIVVAMSGGVDSSVVAMLAAQSGARVVGVTMQLYDQGEAAKKSGACCAGQDIYDAKTVCDRLGIAHYVLDYESRFRDSVIEQFAARGINLTWIQSRPTGESLGRYSFSIDCEGHVAEARVAEALMGLHRVCTQVRFLGSYPRASGEQSPTLASTSDRAFADSRAWLQRLLDGRS